MLTSGDQLLAIHYCEFTCSTLWCLQSYMFRLQLGGLHSNAYISDRFAKAYATEGMQAYVELVQRPEREIGTDVLTHQAWSGAK